jgi:hypothetical protein
MPIAWFYYSLLSILLALASWITSNLGGFFIGMLIDVVGGSLAFAWTTDADYRSSGWLRGNPRIGLPSWALGVISRLKERAAPQSEGRGGLPGFSWLAWANLRYWLGHGENFCRRGSWAPRNLIRQFLADFGRNPGRTARSKKEFPRIPKIGRGRGRVRKSRPRPARPGS